MTAGIGHGEPEVGIGLLARLQTVHDRLALFGQQAAARIAVQHQLGVLELFGKLARADHLRFFVAREREDHVPLGLPTLALQIGHVAVIMESSNLLSTEPRPNT